MLCTIGFNLSFAQHQISEPNKTLADDTPKQTLKCNSPPTETEDNDISLANKKNTCFPQIQLRTLLTLRCKKTNDELCAKLIQHKRHLSKAELTELRHVLREYARQSGMHKSEANHQIVATE